MKKIPFLFIVLLMSILFAGCSNPRMSIDTEWTQKPSKVKILFTEAKILNDEDFEVCLLESANFSDWFKKQILANIGFYALRADYSVESIPKENLTTEKITLGKETIRISKPNTFENDADVYLVLSNLSTDTTSKFDEYTHNINFGGNGVGSFGVMVTTSEQHLLLKGNGSYAFYDAKSQKRLGYGKIEARAEHGKRVSTDDWKKLAQSILENVFEKTPLEIIPAN